MMTRITQLIKAPKKKKKFKSKSIKLSKNPQKKAICLKILTMSPKKPNSANRRISKASIPHLNTRLSVKIPGEKHNLQQHSTILVRGGRVRDLIGVRYIGIRGKFDLFGVQNRKTSRSIYGVKKK
jgi:small subunit ribosomal protein S12